MELFLMTLVIPMFGIFGMLLGGMVKNFGLKKMAEKGVAPPVPPVGGILPTVAQLFRQKAKAKQEETQQGGSTPPLTGDTGTSSGVLRKLLEAQSNSPFWRKRQPFGRGMRDERGSLLEAIEEVMRNYKGGQ